MKILHYSLGFPPFRSGGMTIFCNDLMLQQEAEGDAIALLWPGRIQAFGNQVRIREHRAVGRIGSYEIIGACPVPYDEGIKNTEWFLKDGDKEVYSAFLQELRPDVIHIHTLMGLHRSFLEAASEQGIRLVYTTHDYYPFCARVTMFRNGKSCTTAHSCRDCGACCSNGLSLVKMMILQSALYRLVKEAPIVKKLRKQHRNTALGNSSQDPRLPGTGEGNTGSRETGSGQFRFQNLRQHYVSMLGMMDCIHCNSTLAESIYREFCADAGFDDIPAKIVPVSHGQIRDRRMIRTYDLMATGLRITYLGPRSEAKGFGLLQKAVELAVSSGRVRYRMSVNVFFPTSPEETILVSHERYSYPELEKIFSETDVVVIPSLWKETFGLNVPEALSYGVPLIISDNVGAMDVIPEGAGIVIQDITAEKLALAIESLDDGTLQKMNLSAVQGAGPAALSEVSRQIREQCYEDVRAS